MLKNFWYACEFSSAITSKPKRVSLLNQEFVLYRNSKAEVVALDDVCPHRGAALSNGWVEDDCIRCPYHGWKYQTDGTCIQIPANQPGVPIPKRAHTNVYPVQEKYGFIWLFWGNLPENERPALPSFPEVKNPALRPIQFEFKWNAHYTRLVENSIDPAHSAFVHANSFGSGMAQEPELPSYEIRLEEWGATSLINLKQHKPKGFFWSYTHRKDCPEIKTIRTFYMPNIIYSDFARFITFVAHVPVDDNTTLSKFIQFRSFLTQPWADSIFRKYSLKINQEDKLIVESQYPQVVPDDLTAEIHTPSDALSLAYRKLRKKCLDMGYHPAREKITH
ncbi:aromatic ring-hydroxylating dioxygenase subunit alpha [aff. Roholtiella sp. LEGE 12411]|uniref:aromatic ring-hydroxylating dioxygenase subunit alpha n=1 Tax=aff. Roholtiella sp. LEGE 12411 TaxID=1828822 RepID=UPI00187F5B07|nr:aromatic ring-hydroxylating dioxygenase subunit alpha [aff. Roholtiella sp. LEGE 12411]MBE9035039.1 aromatic ring-hydroxylating dioxygenase subunit alpha [aff. Roholtiella sp. LEGE 12411]